MTAKILDGKAASAAIRAELTERVAALKAKGVTPGIATVLVGADPASQLYVGINKSTASHHFKILREAGLTERVVIGGQTHQLLRSREVDDALPGVLPSVVAAARG